ncbi:MAG: xanthine dehydrogenase family protein molybdopterin-binding subunit, partial [Acidobacteria bacterium]|nr:xanthine dehydrogenase family protein molybdopterin-binding subunit [Acidobacteriota bacterium]
AIHRVAGEARWALLKLASIRLGIPVELLIVKDGVISGAHHDSSIKVSYGELIGGQQFNITLTRISDSPYYGPQFEGTAPLKPLTEFTVCGQSIPRFDIPGKVFGERVYIQDLQIPGMLHARVVRPKGQSRLGSDCKLISVDKNSVAGMPGLVDVIVKTDAPLRASLGATGTWPYTLVAVVCEREEQAIAASEKLKVTWAEELPALPNGADVYADMRARGAQPGNRTQAGDVDAALASAARVHSATYKYPLIAHASIGASCGVADVRGGQATVWTDDYIVHPARTRLARMLGLTAENVRVQWVEGSGSYGANAAQQAAIDAALISQIMGRPIRVQYMRHDEIGREDFGPASSYDIKGGLDANNRIVAYEWHGYPSGPNRSTRDYLFASGSANFRFTTHAASQVVTTAYLRGPGSSAAAFPTESFLDELAALAKEDPFEFRLKHLSNPEVIDVLRGAADRAGWQARPSPNPANVNDRTGVVKGRGIAYGYWDSPCAVVAEVEVDQTTGQVRVTRLVSAIDIGWVVNPDAARNQMEGGAIMGASWALYEEVGFENNRVNAQDWISYRILKFSEAPHVDVVFVNNRADLGWHGGCGETAVTTTPSAIANAVFDATGARVRQLPLTPEHVLEALSQR